MAAAVWMSVYWGPWESLRASQATLPAMSQQPTLSSVPMGACSELVVRAPGPACSRIPAQTSVPSQVPPTRASLASTFVNAVPGTSPGSLS